MSVLLALGAALLYGAGDFLGGSATRRHTVWAVLLVSTPVGLAALAATALLLPGDASASALAWGALAGAAGGAGMPLLYAALAAGPMSVVAPVSALVSALLPIGYAVLGGERLAPSAYLGVALCLAAITLVGLERDAADRPARPGRGALLALVSGFGFGGFFILIQQTGDATGVWPLVAAKSAGLIVIVLSALLAAGRAVRSRAARPAVSVLAVAAGLIDALGDLLYLLAARAGLLSLAVVISSLYPAVTVLLARLVHAERLRAVQRVGLALALLGLVLVAR